MKYIANYLTVSKFSRAGLGSETPATVLILDTPMLRTTKMLFDTFPIGIERLIIVEHNPDVAADIHRAIQHCDLRNRQIDIVNAEVINYLQSTSVKIDFIWLDLQSDRFELAHLIDYQLSNAQCFAVTIAARSRSHGSVSTRVDSLTQSVEHVMPHKVVDFGYKMGERRAPMQLIVYSKHWSPCDYNLVRRRNGEMYLAGYPEDAQGNSDRHPARESSSRRSARLMHQSTRSLRASRRRALF